MFILLEFPELIIPGKRLEDIVAQFAEEQINPRAFTLLTAVFVTVRSLFGSIIPWNADCCTITAAEAIAIRKITARIEASIY